MRKRATRMLRRHDIKCLFNAMLAVQQYQQVIGDFAAAKVTGGEFVRRHVPVAIAVFMTTEFQV